MPGETVFLDTSGWIALLNASDSLHNAADDAWRSLGHQQNTILLTDWIIAETGNGLARSSARQRFTRAVNSVRSSPRARIVFVSEELLDRALTLYHVHEDKNWGLVDCVSFVVMKDAGIAQAFTNDRHFKQAGFQCLLPGV